MQLFGVLDILSFVRVSRLDWLGSANGMDSTRKVCQIFNSNVGEVDQEDGQKQAVELCTNRYE